MASGDHASARDCHAKAESNLIFYSMRLQSLYLQSGHFTIVGHIPFFCNSSPSPWLSTTSTVNSFPHLLHLNNTFFIIHPPKSVNLIERLRAENRVYFFFVFVFGNDFEHDFFIREFKAEFRPRFRLGKFGANPENFFFVFCVYIAS